MNSPGHRKNILAAEDNEIGVGHYYLAPDGGRAPYYHYWVANFATASRPKAPPAAPIPLAVAFPTVKPAERLPEFLRLVNAERAARGVVPLIVDTRLGAAVQDHVDYMAENECQPCGDGNSLIMVAHDSGYDFDKIETLMLSGTARPGTVVSAWKEGASAKPRLFAPSFTTIGAGYSHQGHDGGEAHPHHYWLVMLGNPPKT
jgi:uncharacterized protein YkwD